MVFLALTIIIGLGGMHFGHFRPPPEPLGGVRVGVRGSLGPKNVTFLGATFWFQIEKFLIVWTENTLFFLFFGQKWPHRRPKMVILG